ncbi:MAG: hypothetical protein JWO06_212 [Bacteroidota bacterium]|nr:hypothetical protein [Bacteroidota bacterium]
MERYFKPISMEQFEEMINPIIEDDEFPHEMPEVMENDISHLYFNFENYEYSEYDSLDTYPCGPRTLPNGMPCLFVNAGGDWEQAICFIIYFDGAELRGYIPTKGNVWNRNAKCAFGSEGEMGGEYTGQETLCQAYERLLQEAKSWLPEDTFTKIAKELQVQKNVQPDHFSFYAMLDLFISEKAIIEDIVENIKERA